MRYQSVFHITISSVLVIYSFIVTGCFAVLKEKSLTSSSTTDVPSANQEFTKVTTISRGTPTSVRESIPKIYISSVQSGDTVAIFTDSSCTQKIGEAVATGTSVNVFPSSELADGSYTIYAQRSNSDQTSDCSTVSLNVTVNTDLSNIIYATLEKTTAVSLAANFNQLIVGDQIQLFSDSNCTTQVGSNFTATATQEKYHIHSLTAGTYQYYYKIIYPRTNTSSLSTACLLGPSQVLDGQHLTTSYITKWQTDILTAGEKSIRFPRADNQALVINWGDGTSTFESGSNLGYSSHTYTNAGTYYIEVTGTITTLWLTYDKQKLRDVTQWGTYKWKDMKAMFHSITFSTFSATDTPDLTECTSLLGMFANSQFNGNINHWNVSNVTDFSSAFSGAVNFNQPLNNWNTVKATNMSGMFNAAGNFNQPLSNWDTSNVTRMSSMFSAATIFNQDLSLWDTSKVTNMSHMFSAATAFNQNINNWDTSSVTNMSSMFKKANSFNQPLSNWDVSKVTDFSSMFYVAQSFNQNLNTWDTSSATNMSEMFNSAIFNQPLNNWNTSNVTNMTSMFENAFNFNQDISGWNTSNVTSMNMMFHSAVNFNQDISGWNTSKVEGMRHMFSAANAFNQNLTAWIVNPNVIDCQTFKQPYSTWTQIPNFTNCQIQ